MDLVAALDPVSDPDFVATACGAALALAAWDTFGDRQRDRRHPRSVSVIALVTIVYLAVYARMRVDDLWCLSWAIAGVVAAVALALAVALRLHADRIARLRAP